jgi:transposase
MICRRLTAGDTETILETLPPASENITEVSCVTNPQQVAEGVQVDGPQQVVTDKGYHSNETLEYWRKRKYECIFREAVYGNRRRIGGERGKELLRQRGELLERSFAHAYETGGMRRVYLRGRENILKRILIHLGGFNLSLVMRQWLGKGTPRGWQGFSADQLLAFLRLWVALLVRYSLDNASQTLPISSPALRADLTMPPLLYVQEVTSATGC